jgi:hypothetical protein
MLSNMERRTPITKRELGMWGLPRKPREMYEYEVDLLPLPELVIHEEAGGRVGVGAVLLALLSAIIDLPVPEESGMEGRRQRTV